MKISTDINLKGLTWKKLTDHMKKFISNDNQPNYSTFVLAVSLGIMYDRQKESETEILKDEFDNPINVTVPRVVLQNNLSDIDFLFQTAILTTTTIDLSIQDRSKLAFGNEDTNFKKLDFLTKFANFGADILVDLIDDNDLTTMDNFYGFINKTIEDRNFDIYDVSSELDIDDLDV